MMATEVMVVEAPACSGTQLKLTTAEAGSLAYDKIPIKDGEQASSAT